MHSSSDFLGKTGKFWKWGLRQIAEKQLFHQRTACAQTTHRNKPDRLCARVTLALSRYKPANTGQCGAGILSLPEWIEKPWVLLMCWITEQQIPSNSFPGQDPPAGSLNLSLGPAEEICHEGTELLTHLLICHLQQHSDCLEHFYYPSVTAKMEKRKNMVCSIDNILLKG